MGSSEPGSVVGATVVGAAVVLVVAPEAAVPVVAPETVVPVATVVSATEPDVVVTTASVVVADDVAAGSRPRAIEDVSDVQLKKIIVKSWCQNPNDRLSINQIVEQLEYVYK